MADLNITITDTDTDYLIQGVKLTGIGEWTPASISGLQLWLDFSDISTLYQDSAKSTPVTSDGDVIGCAADKSGNGDDATQATSASKPTWQTGEKNGLAIAQFDGTDDYMTMTGNAITQQHVFIVAKNRDAGTVYSSLLSDGSNGVYWFFTRTSSNYIRTSYNSVVTSYTGIMTSYSLVEIYHDGTDIWVNKNAGTPGSATVAAASHTYTVLCARRVSDYRGPIDFGEILIYNATLTGDDLTNVRTFLNNKWAVY